MTTTPTTAAPVSVDQAVTTPVTGPLTGASVYRITLEQSRQAITDAVASTGLRWSQLQGLFDAEGIPTSAFEHTPALHTIEKHLFLLNEPSLADGAPAPAWLDQGTDPVLEQAAAVAVLGAGDDRDHEYQVAC